MPPTTTTTTTAAPANFRLSTGMSLTLTPALRQQITTYAASLNISMSKVAIRAMLRFVERPQPKQRLRPPRFLPTKNNNTTINADRIPAPSRTAALSWSFPYPEERTAFEQIAASQGLTTTALLRRVLFDYTYEPTSNPSNQPNQPNQPTPELLQAAADAWGE